MARISFSSMLDELVGKLAGSVFQDSYFGNQIRTRVSPANTRTYYQQLRRGEFAYLTGSWRALTTLQVFSWTSIAGSNAAGRRLFTSCNINLSLSNIAPVATFTNSSLPPIMPISIDTFSAGLLKVIAPAALKIVPSGMHLIIYATFLKEPSKIFSNPSMYSPIASFPGGSDGTAAVDISSFWIARYGQFVNAKRLCIKSVLINDVNGLRGAEYFDCAIEPMVATNRISDAIANFLIDADGTFITFP